MTPRSRAQVDAPSYIRLAVCRCFLGAPRSSLRMPSIHRSLPSRARSALSAGIGAAGDMSSMSAYFATVFRLTWSARAISDLECPAAPIDRLSFAMSRGTVISSTPFPAGLAKVTARENHTARVVAPVYGVRPSCSIIRAHGAQFPMNTRTTSY